jgi:hypothetical protein
MHDSRDSAAATGRTDEQTPLMRALDESLARVRQEKAEGRWQEPRPTTLDEDAEWLMQGKSPAEVRESITKFEQHGARYREMHELAHAVIRAGRDRLAGMQPHRAPAVAPVVRARSSLCSGRPRATASASSSGGGSSGQDGPSDSEPHLARARPGRVRRAARKAAA